MKKIIFFALSFFYIVAVQSTCAVLSSVYNDTAFEYVARSQEGRDLFVLKPFSYTTYNTYLCGTDDIATLVPTAYWSVKSQKLYKLMVDEQEQRCQIEKAYKQWKDDFPKKRLQYSSSLAWYESWVGGTIYLRKQQEFLGYVRTLTQIVVANNYSYDSAYLHWSRGLFSKLGLQLHLKQQENCGSSVKLESHMHEGVILHSRLTARLTDYR